MRFNFFNRKVFFTNEEHAAIIEAIKLAEMQTSGEIRVFVESRCKYMDPLYRAEEVFWSLKMDNTKDRNAVLVYVAVKDHQYAIYADEGIFQREMKFFWIEKVAEMRLFFRKQEYAQAIVNVIEHIGKSLKGYFPYDKAVDKNEIPDDIIFGQ
jgi:uncharacterized membrane protein